MIKAVIIEDEAVAARNLKRMLGDLEQEIEVVTMLESVEESVTYFNENTQDLVFMDIHLSDGNAFQIFEHLTLKTPIIFTTAYNQYTLKAFKQNSVDYLLKPINQEDLKLALDKFVQLFHQKHSMTPSIDYQKLAAFFNGQKNYQKRFLLQIGQKLKPIVIEEVAYFYVENKTTYLTTFKGRSYPIDFSLSQLEEKIDPEVFFRVNRQFLISNKAFSEIYYLSTTRLKVQLQPQMHLDVFVTIDKIGKFKRWLNQ